MSLTIARSSQSRCQRLASPPAMHRPWALPALAGAIFMSLAPVESPNPAGLPGQSCQEQLAVAEAALDAHEGGEVVVVVP